MDNKVWKSIGGYNGRYHINNFGEIKSNFKMFSPSISKDGYNRIKLRKNEKPKSFLVHRIVVSIFIPNPELKPEVNHLNGNKTDNRVKNLCWCTRKENQEHASKIGLKQRGVDRPNHKLTVAQVKEIRKSIGISSRKLAKKYGVCAVTIQKIIKRIKWKHII